MGLFLRSCNQSGPNTQEIHPREFTIRMQRKIKSALVSVFNKDGLLPIVQKLEALGIEIYSTGGTQSFINNQGISVTAIEDITGFPSIFGGRVKTLHPKVFGGILHRRDHTADQEESEKFEIPAFDLVLVDLYPFEETVASGAAEEEIIEKIDIGGISLIRAAAKNFKDVLIVSSTQYYDELLQLLNDGEGATTLEQRRLFAARAFDTSSHYDTSIFQYFNQEQQVDAFKCSIQGKKSLRYGENPHQEGSFYGDFDKYFDQIQGKEVSYNNLIDIESAVQLIASFDTTTFAILKHNNACGIASDKSLKSAYQKAFQADTQSAFGGILIANEAIDEATAVEMNALFFEIAIAPDFDPKAIELLGKKKNRILLRQKQPWNGSWQHRTLLNGVIVQENDLKIDTEADFKTATEKKPSDSEIEDLIFASKVCKHTKSNAIVLAKGQQLLASGVGQTSRVDALNQAIEKASRFGFDLKGATMASDAFFPFPDCVEIAANVGIAAVLQPGGSIKDQLSIDKCNEFGMSMVFTGFRHFKH